MQALSMIDMTASAPEIMSSGKSAEANTQEFGQVLTAQQQPENRPESTARCCADNNSLPAEAPAQQPAENQRQTEEPSLTENSAGQIDVQVTQGKEDAIQKHLAAQADSEKQTICQDEADAEVQKLLVSLLQTLVKGEKPDLNENSATIEKFLGQLSEHLGMGQSNDEPLPTSVDPLTLDLDVQNQINPEVADAGLQPLIKELASQLAEIISGQVEPEVTEAATAITAETPATIPTTEQLQQVLTALLADKQVQGQAQVQAHVQAQGQNNNKVPVETLTQAPQVLQQVLDALKTQQAKPVATAEIQTLTGEVQAVEQDLLSAAETTEEVDPRFAGLLKPRHENGLQQQQQPLHARGHHRTADLNQNQAQGSTLDPAQLAPEAPAEKMNPAAMVELLKGTSPKSVAENLQQQVQGLHQGPGQAQAQDLSAAKPILPSTPMVQLANGHQVAESQIFDQVVARFSGGFNGDSTRMVLRLQPAELGSLRLELMVEGDQIRANLQAQSQQVQEVLERNLPQLRSALAEQGLKIEQFQVDVNQEQEQQGRFDNLAQQDAQHRGEQAKPRWRELQEPEEQIIPLAHLLQNGGGGISLHA